MVMICGTPGSGILTCGVSLAGLSPATIADVSIRPATVSNSSGRDLMRPPRERRADDRTTRRLLDLPRLREARQAVVRDRLPRRRIRHIGAVRRSYPGVGVERAQ